MALDARVSEQVSILRRQLFKLLHVREFGPDAAFVDMCMGFTLPDIICASCNDCRDLDMCRDDELTKHSWNCRVCGHAYDQVCHAHKRRGVYTLLGIQHAGTCLEQCRLI